MFVVPSREYSNSAQYVCTWDGVRMYIQYHFLPAIVFPPNHNYHTEIFRVAYQVDTNHFYGIGIIPPPPRLVLSVFIGWYCSVFIGRYFGLYYCVYVAYFSKLGGTFYLRFRGTLFL